MELKRRPFQGVLNILSFNRHFYIVGLIVLVIIIMSRLLLQWPTTLLWLIIIAFVYGLIMPLVVSAYVYDFSNYYRFDWLKNLSFDTTEKLNIVNINAGFDETSFILKNKFPNAFIKVYDFYNKEEHTEPAIVRARKVSKIFPETKNITTKKIPLNANSTDVIFLLSAIHEIRSHNEKVIFLKECHRICNSQGKVVMVEHLRDIPNFLAFSIGYTHFFSASVWKKAFKEAGFSSLEETKFTPFMSIFNCKP